VNAPRKRRKDATPISTMAAAVAEAELVPDAEVAKRFGVKVTLIKMWRHRAKTDEELAELVADERIRVLDEWRIETGKTSIAASKTIRAKLEANEEIPFELIAVMKTCGQLLIEASALLDPPKGRPRRQPEEPAS
jgi:translation elongation factor EF-Tu-like GTPase